MPELILFAAFGVLVAVAISAISFRLPTPVLLAMVLSLGVLQGFKPVGYISIALVFTLALGPAIVARSKRTHWGLWPKIGIAVLIWQLISVLWAVKIGSVAHAVISTVALLLVYLLARQVAEKPNGLGLALIYASPIILVEALLIILFRLAPGIEAAFYSSPIALLLSEPNVELMAYGVPQNVSDPGKAGGFLLNGNIASLLMAVVALVYVYAFLQLKQRLFVVVAVIAIAGCIATGSKSALALCILIPAVTWFYLLVLRKRRSAYIVAGLSALGVIVGVVALWASGSRLVSSSVQTLGDRGVLWRLAAEAFPERPLLGFGYGGWSGYLEANFSDAFGSKRIFQDFPPHNLFVQAWANAGLPLAILTLIAVALPIATCAILLARERIAPLRSKTTLARAALLAAAVWVLAHSMLDTTNYFGENHTLPFVALFVALIDWESVRPKEQSLKLDEVASSNAAVD
jgi:O-antigen ligase